MKKYFLLLVSFIFLMRAGSQDLKKIADDFQKNMNDPKSVYGKNKIAGKYYDIRGFKMYD